MLFGTIAAKLERNFTRAGDLDAVRAIRVSQRFCVPVRFTA